MHKCFTGCSEVTISFSYLLFQFDKLSNWSVMGVQTETLLWNIEEWLGVFVLLYLYTTMKS